MDRYRDRGEYRSESRGSEGRGRYRGNMEEEGYGRYAMGGRDYATSGRFNDEDEARRGRYGERTTGSFTERSYNAADYGGGRHQDDFYTPGRAVGREGSDSGYGPSPSDDYERHGYGQRDRTYSRGEGSLRSGNDPWSRSGGGSRGSGEFHDASYATFDRTQFNDDDYADPRHNDVGRYGSGDPELGRSVDEHYSSAYRRDQMQRTRGSYEPGPHTGRGPKGYHRSPERIREDICEHLTHHGHIDATDVQIQVENGEVTLTGTVDSRQAKRLAEELAESVPGVRDVHNHLRIARTEGGGDGQHAPAQLGAQSPSTEQDASRASTRGGSRRGSQS